MNPVDFTKEPGRLIAVVSTPENTENLRKWLKDAGLSPVLAYTFDGFVKEIELAKSERGDIKPPLGKALDVAAEKAASSQHTVVSVKDSQQQTI